MRAARSALSARSRLAVALAVTGWALATRALAGCSQAPQPIPSKEDAPPTTVAMDFAAAELFGAPFPSDTRRTADGHVRVEGFPDNGGVKVARDALALLARDARGFGRTSAVFFRTSAPLADVALGPGDTTREGASVFVVRVDEGPGQGVRHPAVVRFLRDAGPYGAPNLLGVLPLQGRPLEPSALYTVVVTTDVLDARGHPLAPAPAVRELAAGGAPAGLSGAALEAFRRALAKLEALGVPASRIAAFTAFTTDAPGASLRTVFTRGASPLAPPTDLGAKETFEDFCVFEGRLRAPVYQRGAPPYETGGDFAFDASGTPTVDHEETARVVVTVPRRPMPAGGYPAVIFSRTGAGGDRPLVDRGPRAVAGGAAIAPGTGPARDFARVGFAAVSVDGPHGGLRNVTGSDEQFLVFNISNPAALRDNVRQSALELAWVGSAIGSWSVDASACPGAITPDGRARFDENHLALFGHSMGATIAPLAAALEPRLHALVLSGAGGSWIENLLHKRSPIDTLSFVRVLFALPPSYELGELDPLLSILQWAGEPADPPVYGEALASPPRHVLMVQGIVDTYIPPPVANVSALGLGLDAAGPLLDATDPRLARFTPLADLLAFGGAAQLAYPASRNRGGPEAPATAVLVQHEEDGIEDGHEVLFQREEPKRQLRCFLATYARGVPVVVDPTSADDACP